MCKEIPRIGRRGNRPAAAILLLAVLPLSACYRAVPLETSQPVPGTRIVAQLTEQGTEEMARWVGPGAVAVEGIAGEVRPSAWELRLLSVQQRNGVETFWNQEPVLFPREALASVWVREFDRTRTYLTAAGVTAGVIVLGRLFGMGGLFGGSGGGEGTPPH
jgi:hypothetical protein